ncbi:hypothetical protein HWV07_15055 [Natronomonas salina]|uniref:hypothetical protein n=1 Tax=Natronomonas salina TaxID=1710540 RepID=UPI0015B6080D|nr:hypothetical protein [Natronomonas salina]QLD90281.1 hypothetical protein HWV07_15055 [Natronomonas salina]
MVKCPRCSHEVDRLLPLPADALEDRLLEVREDGSERSGRACRWCRHEVIEG